MTNWLNRTSDRQYFVNDDDSVSQKVDSSFKSEAFMPFPYVYNREIKFGFRPILK